MFKKAGTAKPTTVALCCLVLLSAMLLLAACGGGATTNNPPAPTATSSSATANITITTDSSGSFVFSPKTLTIKVGTTVVWKNTTQTAHTVTSLSQPKVFNSGDNTPVNSDMTFSFTFTTAGSFPYQCDFHPQTMQGTITVQ
jgi:plastocyanin